MTAADVKAWKIIGAIVLPLLTALLVGAWASKEAVADHNRDVDAIHQDVQRILDVVCAGQEATLRACRP